MLSTSSVFLACVERPHTGQDIVRGYYLCRCFDDMLFVAEGEVQCNPKIHWIRIVSQFSPIPAAIQLSVCIPVIKRKNTDLCLL